jgi:hypothetical protein
VKDILVHERRIRTRMMILAMKKVESRQIGVCFVFRDVGTVRRAVTRLGLAIKHLFQAAAPKWGVSRRNCVTVAKGRGLELEDRSPRTLARQPRTMLDSSIIRNKGRVGRIAANPLATVSAC